MKSFIYIIRRFKTANVLNLLGLTVAFACFYVFMTQVQFTQQYNKGLYEHENLYRLQVKGIFMFSNNDAWSTYFTRPMAESLFDYPQVEDVFVYSAGHGPCHIVKDEGQIKTNLTRILPGSMKALHPKILDGTLEMNTDQDIILTASIARTCFNSTQAVGKPLKLDSELEGTVVGVIEDFPENCMISNGVFTSFGNENKNNLSNWNYRCLVRLHSQSTAGEVEANIKKLFLKQRESQYEYIPQDEREDLRKKANAVRFKLLPVGDTYLSGNDPQNDRGNQGFYIILLIAAWLVIIVAAINFMNFSMAQTPMRIRNINTRKVIGESTSRLRLGMVSEGIIISLTAFLLAMMLCYMMSITPDFQKLIIGNIMLDQHIGLIMMTAFISLLVGIVTTLYPAWFATSFPPALVLKGSFGLSQKGLMLRKLLVGVQLVIAMTMVCYIGILYLQKNYIFSSDYGFDKNQILTARLLGNDNKKNTIRKEILKLPGVEDVCYSQFIPGLYDGIMSWGRGLGEKHLEFYAMYVDWHFLNTYGIKVINGRNFNEHDKKVCIMNKTLKDTYNWVELDKELSDEFILTGICNNFRVLNVRQDNHSASLALLIEDEEIWQKYNSECRHELSVRVSANVDKKVMKKQIEATINNILNVEDTQVDILDYQMGITYEEEFRFIHQVELFSLCCIIITLIGVFCLTLFETEYRRKEIAIRKIMGSTVGEVLKLFVSRYALPLIVALIIAVPIAYYFGEQWLTNFAEHTPIYWWIFPLSFLIVSIVVFLTVIIQSWRVATSNPIESIRTE